ncbi:metal ABC transporter ATP-binding protein [Luteolibacter soli]|uniref:ABC transporter ATP-binding protein n=1 Tax=Luteolibacter soli TaxID=3135280 RepID=A0ABU9AQL8_9BACT
MSHEHHDCCAHHAHHHELVIDSLRVHYRDTLALDGVSFATSCGNRVALVGPNGAGKSTLLKAIAGLVPRTGGSIRWRGSAVKRWSREFAYLPQREEVDWSFPITVRGLVEMGRYPQTGMFRRFRDEDDAAVDAALAALDLLDLQKRQIRELSGGQQQRTFLARALAQEAHVLLLDEPFTGLDRNASRQLGDLLAKLSHEGRLVIASHHDLATAPKLFDEALLLKTRPLAFGAATEALSEANIDRAFGHISDHEDRATQQPAVASAL